LVRISIGSINFIFATMLKGITISQKLYFVVGTMAVLVVVELFALMFCIHTLSSVRAMVGAGLLVQRAERGCLLPSKIQIIRK
jgi:hypothetical protein